MFLDRLLVSGRELRIAESERYQNHRSTILSSLLVLGIPISNSKDQTRSMMEKVATWPDNFAKENWLIRF